MNTDEIKRAIADQFDQIERVQEEIEEADDYQATLALRDRLQEAKFDLAKLQRSLQQAEKTAQDQAQQATLAAYNKKLKDYKKGISQLDQLAVTFREVLATLETCYQDHFELSRALSSDYRQFSVEAKALQQPDLPYPPGSTQPDSELHELCKGQDGTITRKLTARLDPLVLGGWAMPR